MNDTAQPKDEDLVFDYINGDDGAFTEIVDRYLKPIYNFTYRLCGNDMGAEEITQESFLKVWKNIKKFRLEEKFKTWIYAIARNTTIDWLRKKKSIVLSKFDNEDGGNYLEDDLTDTEKIADEIFEVSENKKMLGNLLLELSINYREVMLLRYNEELNFDEIAKMLKKPINTVKSQHRRALIELRKKLKNAPK